MSIQQQTRLRVGINGIGATGRAGQIVLLCSTIAPHDTQAFAERLAQSGLVVIDAPISGGPARARSGEMRTMLSGPATALASIGPLLEDMAHKRFARGARVGDAAKTKLVNNLLAGINLAAGAEALALGTRLGRAGRCRHFENLSRP